MFEHPLPLSARRVLGSLARGRARLVLLGVDALGARPRVHGTPYVENLGRIEIGDDFLLEGGAVRAHLVTAPGGVLRIGNGVHVGSGAAISAASTIEIGDGAHLGRGVIVMDSDFHDPANRAEAGASAAIVIGAGARLGDGTTVMKGARIGARARIADGALVAGVVAEGADFPSTPLPAASSRSPVAGSQTGAELAEELLRVAAEALASPRALRLEERPAQLDGWDSLAALRLLVSLEMAFGVQLAAPELAEAKDFAAIAAIVARQQAASTAH
jgi:acyl carrier protein/serine acetyltransferase